MENTVTIGSGGLTLDEFGAVALCNAPVQVDPAARERVEASRRAVERIIAEGVIAYGINTGFGALKDRKIPKEDIARLQENLVISHAVGLGEPLDDAVVRGMMLLRASSLCLGFSGVRADVVDALCGLLNTGIHPLVPRDGSVGASGDLAPLAHVALSLIGRGRARVAGLTMESARALATAGLAPLTLEAKEGLALTNGTQLMTSYACLLALAQRTLYATSDVVAAMSIEAGIGTRTACDPRVHAARPHPGQAASARNIWNLLEGSGIMGAHRDCSKVQDQYSFRCTPQVHGSSRGALPEKEAVILIEMNSATDNPLVFPDGSVLSGGNFHGAPVALVLSGFCPMIAAIGAISEKRISYLLDPRAGNGLPGFLVADRNSSGFMIPQYVAAAYVAENGKLCAPLANVTTVSTSAGQEDHVSMGPVDGKHAMTILSNVNRILGIEYLCAAQALDLQEKAMGAKAAPLTAAARDLLRAEGVPFVAEDAELKPMIETAIRLVESGRLLDRVRSAGAAME